MEPEGDVPDVEEIAMFTAALDVCALAWRDERVHERAQVGCKDFGDDFFYAMDKADWSEILSVT